MVDYLTMKNGYGAPRLIKFESTAILMEFIDGKNASQFLEIEAIEGLCHCIHALHRDSLNLEPPEFPKLDTVFAPLLEHNISNERHLAHLLRIGSEIARDLFDSEREITVLHGDIHHENVLFSNDRGWIAIDPKPMVGERTFDVANMFFNDIRSDDLAKMISTRADVISQSLKLDRQRLVKFAFAFGCLSIIWQIEDKEDYSGRLNVVKILQQLIK